MQRNIQAKFTSLEYRALPDGPVTVSYTVPNEIIISDLEKNANLLIALNSHSNNHLEYSIFNDGNLLGNFFFRPTDIMLLEKLGVATSEMQSRINSVQRSDLVAHVLNNVFTDLLIGKMNIRILVLGKEGFKLSHEMEKFARTLSSFIGRESVVYENPGPGDSPYQSPFGTFGMLRLKISLRANADNHVIWMYRKNSPEYFTTMVGYPTTTARQVLHSFTELYPAEIFEEGQVPTTVLERDVIKDYFCNTLSEGYVNFSHGVKQVLLKEIASRLPKYVEHILGKFEHRFYFSSADGFQLNATVYLNGNEVLESVVMKTSRLKRLLVPETKIPKEQIKTEWATSKLPDYDKIVKEISEKMDEDIAHVAKMQDICEENWERLRKNILLIATQIPNIEHEGSINRVKLHAIDDDLVVEVYFEGMLGDQGKQDSLWRCKQEIKMQSLSEKLMAMKDEEQSEISRKLIEYIRDKALEQIQVVPIPLK